jgi:hypothetical protein
MAAPVVPPLLVLVLVVLLRLEGRMGWAQSGRGLVLPRGAARLARAAGDGEEEDREGEGEGEGGAALGGGGWRGGVGTAMDHSPPTSVSVAPMSRHSSIAAESPPCTGYDTSGVVKEDACVYVYVQNRIGPAAKGGGDVARKSGGGGEAS